MLQASSRYFCTRPIEFFEKLCDGPDRRSRLRIECQNFHGRRVDESLRKTEQVFKISSADAVKCWVPFANFQTGLVVHGKYIGATCAICYLFKIRFGNFSDELAENIL